MHGDHFFDLPFIILSEYINKRTKKLIIIGPKDLKKELNKLMNLAFKNNLNKYITDLDIIFMDALTVQDNEISNELYLSSIKLVHGNLKNCYGYLLKKNDKTLAITGDTEICPGLTYMLKKASYCLIDVNNIGDHITMDNLKQLIKEYNITFIPVHFPDEIEKELTTLNQVKVIKPGEQFYL